MYAKCLGWHLALVGTQQKYPMRFLLKDSQLQHPVATGLNIIFLAVGGITQSYFQDILVYES